MFTKFQRKRQQGQTMVEFTLIFPVLAILLFGVIQFGIAFNNYLALTDAVRAGSRQAAVARYLLTRSECRRWNRRYARRRTT